MSDIAAQARAIASHVEVKKDGLRQTQDGTWKLTLTVLDMPAWLMAARMGTRMMAALVEIGDDETPVPHESPAPAVPPGERAASGNLTTNAAPGRDAARERGRAAFAALPDMKKDVVKAAMMVQDDDMFQEWLLGDYFHQYKPGRYREQAADMELKHKLHIKSKSEIGESQEVNERWHTLLTTYQRDTNQLAEIRG